MRILSTFQRQYGINRLFYRLPTYENRVENHLKILKNPPDELYETIYLFSKSTRARAGEIIRK